jgi:nucleotide-binding universal stress UspA family protein
MGIINESSTLSMKTILVPMENDEAMHSALDTALLLARRCNSYIEGFALLVRTAPYLAIDIVVNIPVNTEELDDEAKKAKQSFKSFMEKHDVPQSSETTEGVSFGWLDQVPKNESFVGSYGRVFDVIVMNRPNENSSGLYVRAIEAGLFESGRPILLAPPSPPNQIATNVMIAWNRSTEQARVTALSLPLLQKADRITVLTVNGGAEVPGPPAEQLIQYLKRNGIAAELMTVELGGKSTGEAILATAASLNCDLLIKGAYTQSRLRQIVFGGTTQHILKNANLPVLFAN